MKMAQVGEGTGLENFVLGISGAVHVKYLCEQVVGKTGLE